MKHKSLSASAQPDEGDLSSSDLAWLQRLNVALHAGDDGQLAQVFEGVSLAKVLGQRMIAGARARAKAPLVILLSTLAVANEVQAQQASLWLARYQFITGASDQLEAQDQAQVLVASVCMALRDGRIELEIPAQLGRTHIAIWLLILTLAVDHRAWALGASILRAASQQGVAQDFWAASARLLTQRSKFWPRDASAQEAAKLFALTAGALRADRGQQSALQLMQARMATHTGAYDEAERVYKDLLKGPHGVLAHLEYGQMLCWAARKPEAIAVLDDLLSLPLERLVKSELTPNWVETTGGAALKQFAVDDARVAFQAFQRVLAPLETPFFLVSGTLLGYAREGGLLGHDKDIDVGVVGWESQYAIAEALQASGEFTLNLDQLSGERCYTFSAIHTVTDIAIDVFLYHPQRDAWVTGVNFSYGHAQRFGFTPMQLSPAQFLGVETWVPEDIDLNLTENFGPQWRKPDPGYLSHLESPSGLDRGGVDHMITLRLDLFSALRKADTKRLQRALRVDDALASSSHRLPGAVRKRLGELIKQT